VWEEEFLKIIERGVKGVKIAYSTERSIEDELMRETLGVS